MTNKNVKNEILDKLFSFSFKNLDLLREKTFLKPLIKTMIRDSLLDEVQLENSLADDLSEKFFNSINIYDKDNREEYLIQNLMDDKDLVRVSSTQYKSKIFNSKLFSNKTEEYFKKRQDNLDQYIYSFIQVKDQNLSQELYLRLESNEIDFSILASEYSLGPEKYKNGLEGPHVLSKLHPKIQDILKSAERGLICEPFNLNDLWIIIRLEKILYAEFDEPMKNFLSNELFEIFLERLTREIISEIRNKYFSEKFK